MRAMLRTATTALLLVVLSMLGGCQSAAPAPWELPPAVKVMSVNGYPMAYVERGAGHPVVLVHGAVNDYRYWDSQLESLASRYRVFSVSLRHYFPERWNGEGEDFSVQVHAEDVAAFIEKLGSPVFLVAHSRGGSVGAGVAKMRPELVKKLVLLEPSLLTLAPPPPPGKPDPAVERAMKVAGMLKQGAVESGLEFYVDGINGPGTWKSRAEADRQVVRDNAWTIVGGARHKDLVDCRDLAGMKMPVMLVESEKGPAYLRNILAQARKCNPSARHALIAKAGHRMNRDNPAAFDAALRQFLDE